MCEPRGVTSASRIFLDGGGDGRQAIDLAFASAARAAGVGRVLYLPYAMAPQRWPECRQWFEATYGDVFAEVVLPEDPMRPMIEESDIGAIFLGGGHTGRLLDTLRSASLDGVIARHVARGGLLCGGSAGAIVCGATILTAPSDEHSARCNDGLDLLGGASVLAHYVDTDAARATALEMTRELRTTSIWALPENSGVQLDANGTPHAVGEQVCLEFTASGEVIQITRPSGSPGGSGPRAAAAP